MLQQPIYRFRIWWICQMNDEVETQQSIYCNNKAEDTGRITIWCGMMYCCPSRCRFRSLDTYWEVLPRSFNIIIILVVLDLIVYLLVDLLTICLNPGFLYVVWFLYEQVAWIKRGPAWPKEVGAWTVRAAEMSQCWNYRAPQCTFGRQMSTAFQERNVRTTTGRSSVSALFHNGGRLFKRISQRKLKHTKTILKQSVLKRWNILVLYWSVSYLEVNLTHIAHGCESKCKAPIHTLNPQADPYPRSIPKGRWSRPIHTSGSLRAKP